MSSRAKHIAVFVILTFFIVLAITLSSVAIITSASPAEPSKDPLPTVFAFSPNENEVSATGSILPCATVYYHGVKVGKYESDSALVSDVLDHFNITLLENDEINFEKDDSIYWGMNIRIDEVIYEEVAVTEPIPFETVEIPCHTIPKGTREVQKEGINGVVGKILYTKKVNGEIVASESKEETVFKAPVSEEVLVGVGGVFTAPDGTEHNYSYYIDVVATAYTHTGNLTYSGTVAEVGVIAVDPRYIELGSNVYVIGNYGDYGVCRAEDIGGGIKRYRIDVFLDTEEECVIFGRRNMRCYVLE
jgi:3D (Asp-Asp-Asp) domain-containing protein